MDTLVHQSDFSSDLLKLGHALQSFFDDLPIQVQCAVRDERLIVLGQHPDYARLNPAYILKILERKIQSFQLDFTQHVRLYLRTVGEVKPYAHRWFMIQPPPPPLPGFFQEPLRSLESEDEPWSVDDNELDQLVQQLISMDPIDSQIEAIASETDESISSSLDIDRPPIALAPKKAAVPECVTSAISSSLSARQQPRSLNLARQSSVDACMMDDDTSVDEHQTETLALPDLRQLTHTHQTVDQTEPVKQRSLQVQARNHIRLLSRTVLTQLNTQNSAILTPRRLKELNRPAVATTGFALLGFAAAAYGLSRPCVIGECEALDTASELSEAASIVIQNAESWPEIELGRDKLVQAVEQLEPIPAWSSVSEEATQYITAYQQQLVEIEAFLDIEELARTASKAEQTHQTASIGELQSISAIWQEAITTLESEPTTSALYPMALQQLATSRDHAEQLMMRIEREQGAQQALDNAKQAADLAVARQRVARSLENWQYVRVTWIVAVERLNAVPQNTAAGQEARQLMDSYQAALDEVNQRVHREQAAVRILEQAEARAQIAQAAEYRFDWQQAVQDWDQAIAYAQQIDYQTNYQLEAEELVASYISSLDKAQEKLNLSEQIEADLEKTCIGELRICHLLSVGPSVSVQLDEDYVEAINAARNSGNGQLQAVVTDHQLILRRTLEQIAQEYQLSVEVYDAENRLLERHGSENQTS